MRDVEHWPEWTPTVTSARHRVENAGGCSRAHLEIEFTGFLGPLFARVTAKLNDRYLALDADGLKSQCEGITS